MILISNLNLSFGSRDIFQDLNLIVQEKDRIGLVGRNGYGKSTLLKAITGKQSVDSGNISIIGKKRVAYLDQDIILSSNLSIIDFVVTESMKDPIVSMDIEARIRAKADRILSGLGFSVEKILDKVNSLSGGWKMRVYLAYLLVLDADFYLFDEPVNHLDIVAKDWFLKFLKNTSFGFLIVCHEKYFLNVLCDKIFALDTPSGKLYNGNYDSYVEQSEANLKILEQQAIQQEKMIKQKQEAIDKFKAGTRAKQAKSMIKQLERVERIVLPKSHSNMHIPLPEIKPSGKLVLEVENLSGGYKSDQPIFNNINFKIQRGEKIALVAANGVGKTTLLHTIANLIPSFKGKIKYDEAATYSVFYQEQVKALNPNLTVWEEVSLGLENVPEPTLRKMLGSFLFSGDDINKKISFLSGGEKNRVGMIKVILRKSNFLILDEPTNHLDIQTKDILLSALQRYTGTIIFVSHDHDFINKLATSILELTPNKINLYIGNYDDYIYHKNSIPDINVVNLKNNLKEGKNFSNKEEKIIFEKEKIEKRISEIEAKKEILTTKLGEFEYGSNEFSNCCKELNLLEKEENKLLEELLKY